MNKIEKLLPQHLYIKDNTKRDYFFLNDNLLECFSTVSLATNATLDLTIFDFSEGNSHFKLKFNLNENSNLSLKVIAKNKKKDEKKFEVLVRHNNRNSSSLVKMVGINDEKGVLIFKGDSFIKNGSSGSKTRQEGKITNLSAECKSEVSPGLYIKENNVTASHGAALGSYNENVIYYLQSRGLSLKQSKLLITTGELYPYIDAIDDKRLKKSIDDKVKEILK